MKAAPPRFATIAATARFIPEREVNNEVLRQQMDPEAAESIDKLEERTNILTRFYAPEGWATSDLALPAAQGALSRAGIEPGDVDMIIVGTDTPDYVTPATSTVLQHKLGATNAGTFDVGCACASFPTGLAVGAGLIATNHSLRNVLVVGAYLMHKLANLTDPVSFFYGDAAGAVLLVPGERPGLFASAFFADGSYHRHWGIYAGGTAEPATEAAVRAGRTGCQLVEPYPQDIYDTGWPRLVRRLADSGGFDVNEIDFAIFTQVRQHSVNTVMGELGLPMERTHTVMHKWGYTGSACIPLALDDAREHGKLEAGDLLVLVGSGVGYNQAAVALRV